MAKKSPGTFLPSGQGGLIGGFSSSHKTKVEFSPKLVLYFALFVVFLIWVLFATF